MVLEAETGEQGLGEHESRDAVAVTGGELVADHRSPVLAHHGVRLVSEVVHQLGDVVAHRRGVVAVRRAGGVTETAKVGGDDGVVGRQLRDEVTPVVLVLGTPCRSTTAGPDPAAR